MAPGQARGSLLEKLAVSPRASAGLLHRGTLSRVGDIPRGPCCSAEGALHVLDRVAQLCGHQDGTGWPQGEETVGPKFASLSVLWKLFSVFLLKGRGILLRWSLTIQKRLLLFSSSFLFPSLPLPFLFPLLFLSFLFFLSYPFFSSCLLVLL